MSIMGDPGHGPVTDVASLSICSGIYEYTRWILCISAGGENWYRGGLLWSFLSRLQARKLPRTHYRFIPTNVYKYDARKVLCNSTHGIERMVVVKICHVSRSFAVMVKLDVQQSGRCTMHSVYLYLAFDVLGLYSLALASTSISRSSEKYKSELLLMGRRAKSLLESCLLSEPSLILPI